MKALAWHGKGDIRCEEVPDPKIEHPRDAIIKVTACAICGSDLHIYGGIIPQMMHGDILGHENMGEVVEVGPENKALKVGDRVVVPFTISCGECFFCRNGFYSGCERTNPDHAKATKLWGNSPGGLFGYSHLLGRYAGGQAEYLRVPYADVGPVKVPDHLSDEQVLFLSDIFPTGYMGAEFCDLRPFRSVTNLCNWPNEKLAETFAPALRLASITCGLNENGVRELYESDPAMRAEVLKLFLLTEYKLLSLAALMMAAKERVASAG